MIVKLKICTTGKILVEMSVPEIDQQCLNRNMYICIYIYISYNIYNIYIYIYIIYYDAKFKFYLKPYIKNICLCNKTFYFYICTWDCNVSSIYRDKDQQVNIIPPQQPSFLYYFSNFSIFREKCTLPHFLKNKHNSSSHPFYKVGEIQL